ncbi:MAG: ABC transporter ATP-binding protein [Myxococcota bacterium]|nr:ABC transporter ATP-binding protein [Myxococcales bacterium]
MSAASPANEGVEEEALGKAYDLRLLARLWPYVRPYRREVALTLLLFVPIFLLEAAPAWIVKSGIDRVVAEVGAASVAVGERAGGASPLSGFGRIVESIFSFVDEPPTGWSIGGWLALVYVIVTVALGVLQYAYQVLMAATGQRAMRDLRRHVFDHLESLEMAYFDRIPVGRLVTRATNDVENVAEMFAQGLVALVTDVIKMVGYALVLFLLSPKLALWAFAIVPVLAFAAFVFRLKVREAFREVRVRIARINTTIQESVTGMKVVQLFGRETRNMAEFDAMNADHRDSWHKSIRYDSLLFATIEVATGVTMAVIIGVGTGLAEVGIMYVFIDYMQRFFMPLRDLSAKYSVMQSAMAGAERIFQVLDTQPRVRDAARQAPEGDPALRGCVEFEHVWFAYGDKVGRADDEIDWVLRDVSFRVAPGEKVAFVGATGAGKTTIIKLLTRLYDVDRGRVLVDGVDVRQIPQQDLRRRIATVLQDVFLFSGTLARNIALGRADLDETAIRRAARAVEADRFIERLPRGFETDVLERGANFSTGQRQILSFARALAHGAHVLVLDEATSAIDTETEAAIQRGIQVLMEGKTAIAIAHRLSTIRDVDRIHVLAGGRLVESGSHEALLAAGGHYARLYRLQSEREREGLAHARPA